MEHELLSLNFFGVLWNSPIGTRHLLIQSITEARTMHQPVIVRNLGRLSYEKALYIQKTCAALLRNKQLAPHHPNFQDARDTLLLVEHNPPVYTMGIKDSQGDILKTEKEIEQLGAKVIRTTRGGKGI